jgi:hypothetical protein
VRQSAKQLVELVSDKKFAARLEGRKETWRNPFESEAASTIFNSYR